MEMESDWEDDISVWYDQEHIPEIMAVPGVISARRFVRVSGPDVRKPSKYLCIYEIANEHVVLGRPYLTYHTGWKCAPRLHTPWTDQSYRHYTTQRSVRRQVFPIHRSYTDHSGEPGKAPVPAVGSSLEDNWWQPIGSALLHILFTPDPQWEQEILDWHDDTQVPALLACPGFLSARRFMLVYDQDRGDPSVVGHYKYLGSYQLSDAAALETPEYRAARESLDESRRAIPGTTFANEAIYRQVFPETGPFENHTGPGVRRREEHALDAP
jgi:hypothetical protein